MAAYEPSLLDIAHLLDSIGFGDPSEDALQIALWLVRQSPIALDLHAQLTTQRENQPTLQELANLLLAVESPAAFPRCRTTALWLIQQTEASRAQYQRLEEMVCDAGGGPIATARLATVVANHESFARLLAAGDDWNDPAQVLDPSGHVGVDYEALFHLCHARLAASQGEDRQRLELLRDKIGRCAAARLDPFFPVPS